MMICPRHDRRLFGPCPECVTEASRDKALKDCARLTIELEQAKAACCEYNEGSVILVLQASEAMICNTGEREWKQRQAIDAINEWLGKPNPGQPLAARLAAAEAVVARVQDRDFTWTCPHIDCEDSSACEDAMLAAILQETNRDS